MSKIIERAQRVGLDVVSVHGGLLLIISLFLPWRELVGGGFAAGLHESSSGLAEAGAMSWLLIAAGLVAISSAWRRSLTQRFYMNLVSAATAAGVLLYEWGRVTAFDPSVGHNQIGFHVARFGFWLAVAGGAALVAVTVARGLFMVTTRPRAALNER